MRLSEKAGNDMKFDHIGVFVESLEIGLTHFKTLLPIISKSDEYHDSLLKVSVQFVYDSDNTCYELVAPLGDDNPVSAVLDSKKNILNHVAYKVEDIDANIERYRKAGCMPLGPPRPAIAFNNARVIFFLTPVGIIIELIEMN